MRRKVKPVAAFDGSEIPASVLEFVPSDWPGDSQGRPKFDESARYKAWAKSRREWARQNLDNGLADLPEYEGPIPLTPWDASLI